MKIPLYDNNMNFVTTFDLHHTLADLLKKWGYVHVSVPKPISLSFSYGDNLTPSLSVYQIRIRLEHFIRNGEKHPFYFVEADNDALEFLQNYDKNDSYQISDTNYQKWKTSQVEKYAKSSPKVSPTPSALPTLKASMPAEEDDDDSLSWSSSASVSVSPSEAPEDDYLSASPSEAPKQTQPKAGEIGFKNGKYYIYTGSQWMPTSSPFNFEPLKVEKVEKPKKPKKQPSKKKIGLPKEQLKRNIILE